MEYYMPEEMITEILSRLPVESILRFKCVCKSWYVLLTNPDFVSKHLAIQLQSDKKNLMCLKRMIPSNGDDPADDDGTIHPRVTILSRDNNIHRQEFTFELPNIIQYFVPLGMKLIAHCDGLVSFSNLKTDIVVCNPATRYSRILPDSSLRPISFDGTILLWGYDEIVNPLRDGLYRDIDYDNFLGFGYDSATKDYKIVRVVTFKCCKNGDIKIVPRVEVFCIHSDSCWRELNIVLDSPLGTLEVYEIREPYFDGVYYWWAMDNETNQHVLLSFHMADEVFRKTPMPLLECLGDMCTEITIGVYNESIALFILAAEVQDCIDIWALKKDGFKESWSKQLTIKPFIGEHYIGFWNGSDKEFLYIDCYGELAMYNRVTMESEILSLEGVPDTWVAVPYLKTLVSVDSRLTPAVTRKRKRFSSQEEEGEGYYDDINKS